MDIEAGTAAEAGNDRPEATQKEWIRRTHASLGRSSSYSLHGATLPGFRAGLGLRPVTIFTRNDALP